MEIKRIRIENFKSIDEMEFEIQKIGGSYTKIFVGINESGKSNILQAFSYLNAPTDDVNFINLSNQKNEEAKYIDLYFYLEFENEDTYISEINRDIEYDKEFKFVISNIKKNVYLARANKKFTTVYEYEIKLPKEKIFFQEITKTIVVNGVSKGKKLISLTNKNDESNSLKELTSENFDSLFNEKIEAIIRKYEPTVSFWTPSEEYLLSEIDLNKYQDNVNSNKPLKNIFYLAGINTSSKIIEKIDNIKNPQQRSRLVSLLQDSLNNYLEKIWKHDIDIVIEISETGMFSLSIKDKGVDNKHDRFSIKDRSTGAKQFLSLILSISIETNNNTRNNQLILIDEPEQHLHPSGIRDLSKELLNIGKKNYVFISTHSPFLIDKNFKNRHYIIRKNKKAITEKLNILEHQSIIDDEVLREAFGIEVYKDLLNPHSIIVEGASDKIILQKAFNLLNKQNIGITNGHGSNIDTLASKLNHDNISVIVVVDDDVDGKRFKQNILKIGGIYSNENVFTLRDLNGDIITNGTIEDLLDKNFIKSEFDSFFKQLFFNEVNNFEINESKPVIDQIKIFLSKNKKISKWDMDLFKAQISNNFNPSKTSLINKNPLLKTLVDKLIPKL